MRSILVKLKGSTEKNYLFVLAFFPNSVIATDADSVITNTPAKNIIQMIIAVKITHFPHFDLEIFLQDSEVGGDFCSAGDDIDNVAGRIKGDGRFGFLDFGRGDSAHIKNIAWLAGIVNKKIHKMAKKNLSLKPFAGIKERLINPKKRNCVCFFFFCLTNLHNYDLVTFIYFA